MSNELKPCPKCQSTDVGASQGKVNCYSCGIQTREHINNDEAVKTWNARTKPTELERLNLENTTLLSALQEILSKATSDTHPDYRLEDVVEIAERAIDGRESEDLDQSREQLHSLFERVSGCEVSEFDKSQLPYLADMIEGQMDADEGCIQKLRKELEERKVFEVDSPEDIDVVGEEILCFDGCEWVIDYVDVCPEWGHCYMANGTEVEAWCRLPAKLNKQSGE